MLPSPRHVHAEYLADLAVNVLQDAISKYGSAQLALSGGETPNQYLPLLAQRPLKWDRVWITLTDERWVPPADPRSNQAKIQSLIADTLASRAFFQPIFESKLLPPEGARRFAMHLRRLPRPLDLILLGMGKDGHIASLFPGSSAIHKHAQYAVSVTDVASGVPRVSLSRRAIINAKFVFVVFQGSQKEKVFSLAGAESRANQYPVAMLSSLPSRQLHVISMIRGVKVN